MPTYFYIDTNDEVKKLVDNNNLKGLEDYLNSNEKDKNKRLHYILSYATDKCKIKIIDHFGDLLNLNYTTDGNAYKLLSLAIENYTENPKEGELNTVLALVHHQMKNHKSVNGSYALRCMINYCNKTEDYGLVKILVNDYNVDLGDMFHYCIAWNYPKVFRYLMKNFYDKLSLDYLDQSFEIARSFDNYKMVDYVLEYLRDAHPELYKKFKHLESPNEFVIKSNAKDLHIPDEITKIIFVCEFNESIEQIKWSPHLEEVKFGTSFNMSLDKVKFPDTVKSITFGEGYNWSRFNQSLKKFSFPPNLKTFVNYGGGCKESTDDLNLPASLEKLYLGYNNEPNSN